MLRAVAPISAARSTSARAFKRRFTTWWWPSLDAKSSGVTWRSAGKSTEACLVSRQSTASRCPSAAAMLRALAPSSRCRSTWAPWPHLDSHVKGSPGEAQVAQQRQVALLRRVHHGGGAVLVGQVHVGARVLMRRKGGWIAPSRAQELNHSLVAVEGGVQQGAVAIQAALIH